MESDFSNAVRWSGSSGAVLGPHRSVAETVPPRLLSSHAERRQEIGPATDAIQVQPSTRSVATLLVGDDAGCAGIVWNKLKQLQDGAKVVCHWVPRFQDALDVIQRTPIELILCDLPLDARGLESIQRLRQAGGDVPMIALTGNDDLDAFLRLREQGIDDQLSRSNITRTSLQRIVDRVIERREFQVQIESSLRRERLRGRMLAHIAANAPLQDVLADLSGALQQEVFCADCGFAIDLQDGSGETLLWPDNHCAPAQLASDALAHARLHVGPNGRLRASESCVQTITSGGRLLGALAMVPGPGSAPQVMLRTYATLAAELVALAIDRLQTAECLRQSREDLRQLSAQLLSIQEAERQRIAGDLHDVIGQSLSVVKVSIEEAQQQFLSVGTPEAAAVLGRLVPWVKQALSEVRRISMDLRPAMIDDLGILPTLSWFFREFGASCRAIVVEPRIAIAEADIPDALKISIFRILQEAFSNVVKHARATRIQVVLQHFGANIQLAVIDNGTGFDASAQGRLDDRKSGLGLASMRERARVSGGSYTLESTPGVGTCIVVSWYLPD